jgi:hypothetical protein
MAAEEKWLQLLCEAEKTLKLLAFCGVFLLTAIQILPYFGLSQPNVERRGMDLDTSILVQEQKNGLFGNIHIYTENQVSLSEAYVEVNGIRAGNFAKGNLLLRVYDGDTVNINTTAYKRELVFYISLISANIDSDSIKKELLVNGENIQAGVIKFK